MSNTANVNIEGDTAARTTYTYPQPNVEGGIANILSEKRVCPFLHGICVQERCAFWSDTDCLLRVAAKRVLSK